MKTWEIAARIVGSLALIGGLICAALSISEHCKRKQIACDEEPMFI
ncbi:hypothetical protein [Massilicoli timonensis]|nr:hypothetical protein [Massilicoli timonensis]